MLVKTLPAVIVCHNLRSFESRFLAQSTSDPSARRFLESLQIFTRSADQVSSMRVVLACGLCDKSLLPVKRPKYTVFGPNKDTMNRKLDDEFSMMLRSVERRIEQERIDEEYANQGRVPGANPPPRSPPVNRLNFDDQTDGENSGSDSGTDDSDNGMESDFESDDDEDAAFRQSSTFIDADEDDENDEEGEERLSKSFAFGPEACSLTDSTADQSQQSSAAPEWTSGPALNEYRQGCKHARNERTLIIRDSLSYTQSSLQSAVTASKDTLQKEVCNDPNSSLHLSSISKSCICCKDKYPIAHVATSLLDFTKDYFNDEHLVNDFFKKMVFPYKALDRLAGSDGRIDQSVVDGPIPEFSFFKNELRDSRTPDGQGEVSLEEYEALLAMCSRLNIETFGELIGCYNLIDILLTVGVCRIVDRFYYEQFQISVLRFGSLSKFAFEILVKGASERGLGMETVMNADHRAFLQKSVYGGLSHCLYYGGQPRFANAKELPNFLAWARQRHFLSLGKRARRLWLFLSYFIPFHLFKS